MGKRELPTSELSCEVCAPWNTSEPLKRRKCVAGVLGKHLWGACGWLPWLSWVKIQRGTLSPRSSNEDNCVLKKYNWSLVLRLPGKWQLWWCILQSKRNLPSKMAIFYFYLCSHLMWTHITDIKYPSTKPLFGFCNQESRTPFLPAPAFWTLVCGFGEQVRQRTENPRGVTLGFLRVFFLLTKHVTCRFIWAPH